ncbi:hypothetical protein [Bdellovibrio sp. HCB288]|uniref:hypothetical protein n=1 Tax=Bdellovibrio sp. HCB288 TaxID=3394355 RepID=UPI0039B3C094
MMNSKQKIIVPIIVVLGLAAFSLFILKQRAGHVGHFPEDMPPIDSSAGVSTSGFLPTSMENPDRYAALNKNIKAMGECLDMKVQELSPQDDFNFEIIGKLIAPDMGKVINMRTKWTSVDYKMKDGETRRVFVEYAGDSNAPEAEPVKTVHHYVMLVSGKVRDLRLPQELEQNPKDSEIQKIYENTDLLKTSRSLLITYENGDELSYVEQNGKAYSVVVSHLGKYFRCKDADSAQMSCSCN